MRTFRFTYVTKRPNLLDRMLGNDSHIMKDSFMASDLSVAIDSFKSDHKDIPISDIIDVAIM